MKYCFLLFLHYKTCRHLRELKIGFSGLSNGKFLGGLPCYSALRRRLCESLAACSRPERKGSRESMYGTKIGQQIHHTCSNYRHDKGSNEMAVQKSNDLTMTSKMTGWPMKIGTVAIILGNTSVNAGSGYTSTHRHMLYHTTAPLASLLEVSMREILEENKLCRKMPYLHLW